MSKIHVVGSINTDFVVRTPRFPAPGETVLGETFDVYGGGKGANQAIAAARLGATVEFYGAVGVDANSNERLASLQAEGVAVRHVMQVDGFGGVAFIQVETSSGQNAISLVPGANTRVCPDSFSPSLDRNCEAGDVICLQLEIPLESVGAALRIGRERDAVSVLNAAPFDERCRNFLTLVDVLVVNEIEAGQLQGVGKVDLADAQRQAAAIRALGVRRGVIITLGSNGAWLIDDETSELIPTPTVPVVDTTAAGDAFCGALCAWLAGGAGLAEAAKAACFAGALAVQRHGAQPSLPTRSELERFLPTAPDLTSP